MGSMIRQAGGQLGDVASVIRSFSNWPVYAAHYAGVAPGRYMTIRLREYGLTVKSVGRHWEFHSLYRLMFEHDEYRLRRYQLAPGSTIIDIGAHIGWFMLSSSVFAPRARYYAYEPFPENYKLLKRNIETNGLTSARAFNVAVAGRSGDATLKTILDRIGGGPSTGGTLVADQLGDVPAPTGSCRVRVTTLDDIVRENEIEDCAMLKMDCEGTEHDIFAMSSDETLRRIRRISLEVHDVGSYGMDSLTRLLRDRGYNVESGGIWGNILYAIRRA